MQIVRGLKVLHSNNIIHSDLKPENILMFKDGRAKLGDFNIAMFQQFDDEGNVILQKAQRGTPIYSCPENWKEIGTNEKMDIWSLGIMIYEMGALELPFEEEEQMY